MADFFWIKQEAVAQIWQKLLYLDVTLLESITDFSSKACSIVFQVSVAVGKAVNRTNIAQIGTHIGMGGKLIGGADSKGIDPMGSYIIDVKRTLALIDIFRTERG